jgi:hypothetical protein
MKKLAIVVLVLIPALVAAGIACADTWRFAAFGDSRGGSITENSGSDMGVRSSVLSAIVKSVQADQVDLVVFSGDEVDGRAKYGSMEAQLKKWKKIMQPLVDANIPVYAFRGNHEENEQEGSETSEDPVKAWEKAIGDTMIDHTTDKIRQLPGVKPFLTYSIDHKNARFVCFDQYIGRSKTYDSTKYDSNVNYGVVNGWVLQQIQQAQSPWVFAFGHEPAFILHHTDCMANAPIERDDLWDALGSKGGIFICGHDHMYVRCTAPDAAGNDVTEIVSAAAGAPLYPYDNKKLNEKIDVRVVPEDKFVNAHGGTPNTNGLPAYFGYTLVTIEGDTATFEFKAFKNYDYKKWVAPEEPDFVTIDRWITKAKRTDD